jgi:hypothetical protein
MARRRAAFADVAIFDLPWVVAIWLRRFRLQAASLGCRIFRKSILTFRFGLGCFPMKRLLLAAVGVVSLGLAAPASAADLAARPYTKAPAMGRGGL